MTSGPVSRVSTAVIGWISGRGAQLFFGAVFLWVIAVFLLITVEPEPGAESTGALEAAVRSSLTGSDAEHFARLFAADTVGEEYPATLLNRLTQTDSQSWVTQVREVAGRSELVLSGTGGCLSWALTRSHDRWLLDGVPAVRGAC